MAALLRLHDLGAESVWLDEVFSIDAARGSLGYAVAQTSTDVHPPLYYVILHYWIRVAGSDEAAARLLSVVFSLGIIAATVAVGRRLLDRGAALAAAALLAVSPFQVEFAQEARMYSLLALLATLSVHTFLEAFILNAPRPRWIAAYIAVTTLMLYTHVYSVFVVAVEVAIVAIGALTVRGWFTSIVRTWLAASAAIVVLYLPWLATLSRQVARVRDDFWIPEVPWFSILQPAYTYAGSFVAAALLAPLALWSAWQLGRREGPVLPAGISVRTILLVWLVAPVALPFVVSQLGSPIFLPKYTIAASVPFALLAGYGASRLPSRWLCAGAVALVASWSFVTLDSYYRTPRKDGWRDAVARIEARAHPGDLILIYRNYNRGPFEYYARRGDLHRVPLHLESPADAGAVTAAVDRATAESRRVWFVTLTGETAAPLIAGALDRRFDERAHTTAQRIETFLFERRSSGVGATR